MSVYLREYFVVHCRDFGLLLVDQVLLPTWVPQKRFV